MDKLGNNTKTAKAPEGWQNLIMHLSPINKAFKVLKSHREEVLRLLEKRMGRQVTQADLDSIQRFNSCPWAGACAKYCLDTSGRGKFSNVQIARAAKTLHKALDSDLFDLELVTEIQREAIKAHKKGQKLAVRLNGTSDLDFTKMVIQHFEEPFTTHDGVHVPQVTFYDYTKSRARIDSFIKGELPDNYYLTYSYDRKNDKDPWMLETCKANGVKVAIMERDLDSRADEFRAMGLHDYDSGNIFSFPTIDGDAHDLRFLDAHHKGFHFVVLKEKGDAK